MNRFHHTGNTLRIAVYSCPMHQEILSYNYGICPICRMVLEPTSILENRLEMKYYIRNRTISNVNQRQKNCAHQSPNTALNSIGERSLWRTTLHVFTQKRNFENTNQKKGTFDVLYKFYVVLTATIIFVLGVQHIELLWLPLSLILIFFLRQLIERQSAIRASSELEFLIQLMPIEANAVINGRMYAVKADTLKASDIIFINAGETIAADGIIEMYVVKLKWTFC